MRFRLLPALPVLLVSLAGVPGRAQQEVIPLDTVRVSAASRTGSELAAATRAVEVIRGEALRALPAASVQDALEWAFGLDLTPRSPALADVSLRGSSFEQVLVMVDGVRVSDAQTGHFDLSLAVPLQQVERIEVLRGPASALYGADAVGGVINVVTRREGAGLAARAEAGSFSTVALALSQAFQPGTFLLDVAGDYRRSDGHRTGTDHEIGQLRAAAATPLAGRMLRGDVAFAARDFGADGFYGAFPSYEETRTLTATLGLRAGPTATTALEPVVSVRRHADDFVLRRDDPAFYRNRHTTWQVGGELNGRLALAPRLRLAGGVEGYRDRIESGTLGDRAEDRAAVLAEVAAGEVGRATATAGLRADWHEAFGASWSPSLGTAWWPVRAVRLRASLGHAFRTPTWTERYYRDPVNIGTSDLRPERAWSGEAGLDVYPAPGVRVAVGAFAREADDLIDWARPAGDSAAAWRTRNVVQARFRGVEVEAEATGPLGVRWTAQGSWLSVEAADAAGFTSKYALRPLVETLALRAERAFPGGFALALRAERARRVGEGAYLPLDARASYSVGTTRLYLDLRNATDEHYPDIAGLPAAGRALYAGVDWRR